MATAYTLTEKIRILQLLDETQHDFDEVSRVCEVPKRRLKLWYREREALQHEYTLFLQDEAAQLMAKVQYQAAKKALDLIQAIDDERIRKAPLNQVASAAGVLVDRYLKLEDETATTDNEQEKVIRIEYYDATTGQVSQAPPWSEADSKQSSTIQSSRLREALRQDRNSENHAEREGTTRDANMVAGSHVSDGEPSLARFEDDDGERNWYHD